MSSMIVGQRLRVAVCAGLLLMAGCATVPPDQADNADPWEPFNRVVYSFNRAVDAVILRPVASVYNAVVPDKGREMVHNAIDNVYTPVTFVNSIFQGDVQNTFASFWRFTINSTFGIAGFFDVASEGGLKMRTTDLGDTFAIYGAQPGPYVVIPVLGPSNARDGLGHLGDAFLNPLNYADAPYPYIFWGVVAMDRRSVHMKLIDGILDSSVDPYVAFRSSYTQYREADIKRAKAERAESLKKQGLNIHE